MHAQELPSKRNPLQTISMTPFVRHQGGGIVQEAIARPAESVAVEAKVYRTRGAHLTHRFLTVYHSPEAAISDCQPIQPRPVSCSYTCQA